MPDVGTTLVSWSNTSSSNSPAGSTVIGAGLDDNLREIQGVIVRGLSYQGSDIASAGTADLGAVEGLMHTITGTVTITSFGTVRQGILKIVKFSGALTLTHNATSLILLGGANRKTANGDVGIYISEGSGNWRELSFTAADQAEETIASATTTNIGATRSTNIQITGVTTITSFGTVAAGTYRQGRFAGILTLTHSGTALILPGAANITTAANDRFGALSLGSGNWLVLWYQTASGGPPFVDSTAILKGSADATKLLAIEVDTNVPTGTTVTLTAPAASGTISTNFSKSFTSANQTLTAGGLLTLAHSLGAAPTLVQMRLINTSAELNYSVSDEIIMNEGQNGSSGSNAQWATKVDATNITIRFSSVLSPVLPDFTSGALTAITIAKWALIVKAWA